MTFALKLASVAFGALSIATPIAASAASCNGTSPALVSCTYTPGDPQFVTSGDTTPPITGRVAAVIGSTAPVTGVYQDIYQFTVDAAGIGSGTFATSIGVVGQGIDFTSATFNGISIPITGGGTNFEQGKAGPLLIKAGQLNNLIINYTSAGLGTYGGNLTFTPVPEPALWGMMVAGFGFVGASMRRRRVRVQFA
jgi:hypothetical protein